MNLSYLKRYKRHAALVLLALATAGAVTGRETPTLELIERRPASAPAAPGIELQKLERVDAGPLQADPFAPRSFSPPPPPPVAAAPARPSAPPLPFTYMGRMIENGKVEVLLLRGEEHFSVKPGQKVDAQYRVDKVTEEHVTFTYLPLKTKQILEIQAVN